MEMDGDRLTRVPFLSPRSVSLPHSGFFLSNGDRWRGAPGAGPGRLIIDQKDRDGSRGGEDIEERRRSGRNLWNLCFRSRDVGPAALVYWKLSKNEVRLFCCDCRSTLDWLLCLFSPVYPVHRASGACCPRKTSDLASISQYRQLRLHHGPISLLAVSICSGCCQVNDHS